MKETDTTAREDPDFRHADPIIKLFLRNTQNVIFLRREITVTRRFHVTLVLGGQQSWGRSGTEASRSRALQVGAGRS